MARIPHTASVADFLEQHRRHWNGTHSHHGHDGNRTVPVTETENTLATAYLATTLITQLLATTIFFARVYTRARPVWRFTTDDYIVSVAWVLMTVMFGLQYASTSWGFDHPKVRFVSDVEYDNMLAIILLPFWGWSTGLVKISIAFMLLRFQQTPKWRIFLYVMIAVNVVLIAWSGIWVMFMCRPYAASWDMSNRYPHKQCWSHNMNEASAYVTSITNVSTDVIFSLVPLTFLTKIRRPLREKLVIGFLMSLGLIASVVSLCRAIFTRHASDGKDQVANFELLAILSCLEVQMSLIAACVPSLRSSSKRLLVRMGILHPEKPSTEDDYRTGDGCRTGDGYRSRERGGCTTGTKDTQRVDLHRVRTGESSTSNTLTNEDFDEEDAQYEMDPQTGRIMRTRTPESRGSRPRSPKDKDLPGRLGRPEAMRGDSLDEADAQYEMDPNTGRIVRTRKPGTRSRTSQESDGDADPSASASASAQERSQTHITPT